MAPSSLFKKSAIAMAAAAAVTLSVPASVAQAGPHHHGGDAFAAGIIGGILGAVIAAPPPAYAVPVYPAPEPVYVSPVPVYDKYFEVYDPPPVIAPAPVYPAPGTYYEEEVVRVPLSEYSSRRVPSHDYAPRHDRGHDGGPRVITYDDTVGRGGAVASTEPWSPGWHDYCRAKFRSFDAKSGTYLGYDGKRHFCVVR